MLRLTLPHVAPPVPSLCCTPPQQARVRSEAGFCVRLHCGNGAVDSSFPQQPLSAGESLTAGADVQSTADTAQQQQQGADPGRRGGERGSGNSSRAAQRGALWWRALLELPGSVLVATPAALVMALVPGHIKVSAWRHGRYRGSTETAQGAAQGQSIPCGTAAWMHQGVCLDAGAAQGFRSMSQCL